MSVTGIFYIIYLLLFFFEGLYFTTKTCAKYFFIWYGRSENFKERAFCLLCCMKMISNQIFEEALTREKLQLEGIIYSNLEIMPPP